MDATAAFASFVSDLKQAFPDIGVVDYDLNTETKAVEEMVYSSVLKIVQKDETFFTSQDRIICGLNVSTLWKSSEANRDAIWKHMIMLSAASFLHGDIKDKLGRILETVKGLWSSSGQENPEISKILNDESAEDKISELVEYVQNTRIAKMLMELVEESNVEDFIGDLNFDNPEEIMELLKNPEHPKIKPIISKVQTTIQGKLQRGHYTQQQLMSEVEGIKAKLQSMFGNVMNEMLGGRRADVPATVLTGNSPEARRQRMLARLQKKQREKNSR
jgi:hypothetical protein